MVKGKAASPDEPTIVGFMAYHTVKPPKRLVFIDELHVAQKYRKQKFAHRLLNEVSKFPMELIVQRKNNEAMQLYLSLGFCGTRKDPSFPPKPEQFSMRTTSFRETQKRIGDALAGQEALPPKFVLRPFSGWHNIKPKGLTTGMKEMKQEYEKDMKIKRTGIAKTAENSTMHYVVIYENPQK